MIGVKFLRSARGDPARPMASHVDADGHAAALAIVTSIRSAGHAAARLLDRVRSRLGSRGARGLTPLILAADNLPRDFVTSTHAPRTRGASGGRRGEYRAVIRGDVEPYVAPLFQFEDAPGQSGYGRDSQPSQRAQHGDAMPFLDLGNIVDEPA